MLIGNLSGHTKTAACALRIIHRSGRRGRRFKSGHPDQNHQVRGLFAYTAAETGRLLGDIWETNLASDRPRWSLI
jgi:hypothetical protein